jgi:uncharacterized repeat protein (TIGR03803 family)
MKLHRFWVAVGAALAVLVPAMAVIAVPSAQAQTYSVLYSFTDKHPKSPGTLIRDERGNLYGTTYGYVAEDSETLPDLGTASEIKANGTYKRLHRFTNYTAGVRPEGKLVRGPAGSLYGTTLLGGGTINNNCPSGCGTVYELKANGNYRVLYSFTDGTDGGGPRAGMVRDSAGNLYGTAAGGGIDDSGVLFKVDTTGTETVLHSFAFFSNPQADLLRDSAGNLYGVTPFGGANGYGVIFELETSGDYKILYSFTAGDGAEGVGPLVRDRTGNLYGTTVYGGDQNVGSVFKLDATGTLKVLYSFTGGADGAYPLAGLVRDSAGNLYGTTSNYYSSCDAKEGCGAVFELKADGNFTVLHTFTNGADGGLPEAALTRDSAGNLYGTTVLGGANGSGVVFKITPQ